MTKSLLIATVILTMAVLNGCGQKPADEVSSFENNMTQNSIAAPTEVNIETMASTTGSQPTSTEMDSLAASTSTTMSAATGFAKPTVEEIQRALKNTGLYKGEVDGDLGPRTRRAIEYFQSQNSLVVDGKVGPKTWGKLSAYLNQEPLPETTTSDSAY